VSPVVPAKLKFFVPQTLTVLGIHVWCEKDSCFWSRTGKTVFRG